MCLVVTSMATPLRLTVMSATGGDDTQLLTLDVCNMSDPMISANMDMPYVCQSQYVPPAAPLCQQHSNVPTHTRSGYLPDLTKDRPPKTS